MNRRSPSVQHASDRLGRLPPLPSIPHLDPLGRCEPSPLPHPLVLSFLGHTLHLSSYVKCCIDPLKSPRLSFTANPARRFPENHIMPDRSLTWSRIGPKTMPAQPTWFQLLPEILDVLRGMEASHLDRQGGPAILRRRPPPRPAMAGRFDRHPGRQRHSRLGRTAAVGRQRRPSSQRSETDLSPIDPVTSGLLVSLLPLIHRVDRPLKV